MMMCLMQILVKPLTAGYNLVKTVVLKEVLVIDRMFELYLLGTTLDWKEDDFKSEFVIINPNSKSSCGCGESFSI